MFAEQQVSVDCLMDLYMSEIYHIFDEIVSRFFC